MILHVMRIFKGTIHCMSLLISRLVNKGFFIMLILHVWFPSDGRSIVGRDGGREVFCVVRFRSNILRRNRDVVPPYLLT